MVNVGKTITAEQTVMCATIILERFNDLRPDDLKLFTKRFICGDFGLLYDKLDVQTIIEAITKYDNERTDKLIEFQDKENKNLKLEENKHNNGWSEERKKQFNELISEFRKPKEKHPDFGNRNVIATEAQRIELINKLNK